MTIRVVLLGAVHPGSGPDAKMRGLADTFTDLGCAVSLTLVPPDRRAVHTLQRALRAGGTTAGSAPNSAPAGTAPGRTAPADTTPFGTAPGETAPDVVLARSHWALPPLIPSLRRLRHRHGTRLVIDVPTPTAAGMREIAGSSRPWPERAGRLGIEGAWIPSAWPWADLVVQYDRDGLPWRLIAPRRRLTLTNGVRVADRPLAPDWASRTSMAFVTAGSIGQWHGVDRLLRGMSAAQEHGSTLTIVGDGPELGRLRSLTSRLGLDDRVRFTGPLTGAAYDRELAAADITVASLGEHRRGHSSLSPLKTRDYLARGLPMLFAGDDPDLRGNPPFTFRAPDDDSAIDFAAVATWLQHLRGAATCEAPEADVAPTAIRRFATDHLDQADRARAILTALRLP